jgi:hypothetical protein
MWSSRNRAARWEEAQRLRECELPFETSALDRTRECHPAIVDLLRRRVVEDNDAWMRDDRPWYVRWLIAKDLSGPQGMYEVREFSECNIHDQLCQGRWIGWWVVSERGVIWSCAKYDPNSERSNGIVTTVQLKVIKFAITESGEGCVINEVDLEGRVKRSILAFPARAGMASLRRQQF